MLLRRPSLLQAREPRYIPMSSRCSARLQRRKTARSGPLQPAGGEEPPCAAEQHHCSESEEDKAGGEEQVQNREEGRRDREGGRERESVRERGKEGRRGGCCAARISVR